MIEQPTDKKEKGLPTIKNKPCLFFAQGSCKKGKNCDYQHVQKTGYEKDTPAPK